MSDIYGIQVNSMLFNVVGALLILIVGIFIAKIISKSFAKVIGKSDRVKKLSADLFPEGSSTSFIKFITKFIYYIVMIFVFIGVAEKLGLEQLTQPLNDFLSNIFGYIPNIFGSLILLLVAWILAKICKNLSYKLLTKFDVDSKISDKKTVEISKIISELVYLMVFLLFIPGILSSLSLSGILSPVENMLNLFLGFIPQLIGAALIFIVGWFIASRIREIAISIINSMGIEKLSEHLPEKTRISEIIGNLIYVMILIPVITASLDSLGLSVVTQPISQMLAIIFTYIPNVFSAFLIIYISYYLAKIVEGIVVGLLQSVSFDSITEKMGFKAVEDGGFSLSSRIGGLVKKAIMLFAIMESFNVMGLESLTIISESFTLLAGRIIMGIVIIGIGLYIGQLVSTIIKESQVKNASILSSSAKIALVILSFSMGLRQMGLANEIINMAFGFIVGGIAIAFAIAFGIGGRDMASKKLEDFEKFLK